MYFKMILTKLCLSYAGLTLHKIHCRPLMSDGNGRGDPVGTTITSPPSLLAGPPRPPIKARIQFNRVRCDQAYAVGIYYMMILFGFI